MSHRQNEPARSIRTCVGCRAQEPRESLLRLVYVGEPRRLVPDPAGKLGGRGVSVHPRRSCVIAAARRGGFARALRCDVSVDVEELLAMAGAMYRRRVEGLLLSASRAKRLALGTDAVRSALADTRHKPVLLLVASDAAGRRDELEMMIARLGGSCVVFGTKAELGHLFGRDEVAVAATADQGIATEVARAARRVTELSEEQ